MSQSRQRNSYGMQHIKVCEILTKQVYNLLNVRPMVTMTWKRYVAPHNPKIHSPPNFGILPQKIIDMIQTRFSRSEARCQSQSGQKAVFDFIELRPDVKVKVTMIHIFLELRPDDVKVIVTRKL